MNLPLLNLLCPPALIGLCYRALAANADGKDAALTQRRLENLGVERTELALRASALKAEVDIAAQKANAAKADAEQAALDLRIFTEEHPLPESKRGLMGRRRPAVDRELEERRQELDRIAELAGEDAKEAAARSRAVVKELDESAERAAKLDLQRAALRGFLRGQLAALVLEALAKGEAEEAARILDGYRGILRGDLMVGTLLVLTQLFAAGPEAAKQELMDSRLIFEQHSPANLKVLEFLIALAQGRRLSRSQLGVMLKSGFDADYMFRLYQLVLALDGWAPDEQALEDSPLLALLWVVRQYAQEGAAAEDWQPYPSDKLAGWAAQGDLVVRAIAAHILLRRGERGLVAQAAGIDPDGFLPPTKGQRPPGLLELVKMIELPGWPPCLAEAWQVSLACHVLASAKEHAPGPLFEAWLEQSYGWPKSDLYWWTLGELKDDAALAKNITGSKTGLFIVARL